MKKLYHLFFFCLLIPFTVFGQVQVVSTNNDDGAGSLRAAITAGNSTSAPYSITFTTAGPISLTAALPEITQSCTITGQSPLVPATATGGTTIERSNGAANFRILKATTSGINLVLQDLILRNGVGAENLPNYRGGGGLFAEIGAGLLTMTRCLIQNCSTIAQRDGAGVQLVSGSAIITDCQFANNTAAAGGYGGGFMDGTYNDENNSSLFFQRCTFADNNSAAGGAINIDRGSTILTNCTFSANQNTGSGNASFIYGLSTIDLIHCTFINSGGSSRTIYNIGTLRLANCLFAGNANTGTGTGNFVLAPAGSITSLGGNVSSDADGTYFNQPSDKNSQSITVGPLQRNNGGLVSTHSIGDCGPAKDAGITSSTAVTLPATDANNQSRINPPDAGAFEVQVSTSVSLSATNSGMLNCANPVLMLTATLTAGSSGSYVFSGPGLSTTSTSNSTTVNQAGSYSVTVSSAVGCTATNSITVSGSPTLVQGTTTAGAITTSGPASCASPARLTAPATGQSFVFTGPGGYVFSNVYRNDGSYTAFAEGVKLGGTYTLTVYSACSIPTTSSIVVQGPSSCP